MIIEYFIYRNNAVKVGQDMISISLCIHSYFSGLSVIFRTWLCLTRKEYV